MSRQKRLLAVLAGLFVLALVYAFWAMPRQQRVATTVEPPPRRPAVETPVAAPAEGTRVRLDLLSRDRERFAGYQRDIFNYPRPAPPPPPPRVEKPPVPPPVISEPAFVPPEVKQELARFTFLGFLEKEDVKTVFLSSGEEIFLVKKGRNFGEGNEFHVTDLTPERLIIRHGEDPRVITIPLVEQEPLVPSVPSRATRPARRPGADFGRPNRPNGSFMLPEGAPVEDREDFSPSPAEGENGFPPAEENEPGTEVNGEARGEEGERMENDMLPPGGAPNE
jgi:hypothetical protein